MHVLGFNWVGLMARSLVCWLKQKKDTGGRGSGNQNRDVVPVFPVPPWQQATSSLSSTETALPATVPEAEGMGREGRERGFRSGDSGHRRRGRRWPAPSSYGRGHGSS